MKFFKITLSDAPTLIPLHKVIGVEVGANTKIRIYLDLVGHRASESSQVIGYEITATTAADAAKTKEQLVDFVDKMEQVLATSWQKAVTELELVYPITAIDQLEAEWDTV